MSNTRKVGDCEMTNRPPLLYADGADKKTIIVNGKRVSLKRASTMLPSDIAMVNASGCTALTALNLPAAIWVYASGCTAMTEVSLPAATIAKAEGAP